MGVVLILKATGEVTRNNHLWGLARILTRDQLNALLPALKACLSGNFLALVTKTGFDIENATPKDLEIFLDHKFISPEKGVIYGKFLCKKVKEMREVCDEIRDDESE